MAAFVVAELVGLREPPPLIAALTALLVVQATLASTLVNGVQRVLSVVAGVALAVLLVSVVGLTWWSLGALVAASIVVGQLLRLGPHLVEVPISAMLVLGVGHAAGAESIGSGRVVETVVGAIVGVLVNIAFPPPVRTRDASGAVAAFADEIAALLSAAADALGRGPIPVDLAMVGGRPSAQSPFPPPRPGPRPVGGKQTPQSAGAPTPGGGRTALEPRRA